MIRLFIGYDQKETAAAHVLHHSIQRQSSMPVSVTFLNRESLRGIFTRPRGQLDSTDFSISRFMVPYLCNYQGWALFMDCDMVCRDDIAKLWAWRQEQYAVQCVKHLHIPTETTKFLGQPQTQYPFKNWSSVMLFNNDMCDELTPAYVNYASGLDLHQFKWLASPQQIGELPHQWNHLVGSDMPDSRASLAHFTTGGPYFKQYKNCEHADDWFLEQGLMLHIDHE